MEKDFEKTIETERTSASAKDGQTRGVKREASPEMRTSEKRKRVETLLKSKTKQDGDGSSDQPTKTFGLSFGDKESVSSSLNIAKVSCSNPAKGCNSNGSNKRKASAAAGEEPSSKRQHSTCKPDLVINATRAEFEAKYHQENQLGEGGFGSVFAGFRREDKLPVAIKHVPKDSILCKQMDKDGKEISTEVAIMLKLGDGSGGTSAPVALLDWYDLDQELIMVMERPIPCVDLFDYLVGKGGHLTEKEAKIIMKQLVDAAKELVDKRIFHRDIKIENILIETGSDVPRVRLIDFGLGCFFEEGSSYRIFYGTDNHIPPEWYINCRYSPGPTTVWQMGVVLFELLHKNAAFKTTRFIKNKLKIKRKLSNDCQDFLGKCLTRTTHNRATLEQLQLHSWLG